MFPGFWDILEIFRCLDTVYIEYKVVMSKFKSKL